MSSRRTFLQQIAMGGAAAFCRSQGVRSVTAAAERPSLAGKIGITTGGLNNQLNDGSLNALTLPKFMRDELGMQLIDFNTDWLESFGKHYVDRVRETADAAGCYFTNLKINHEIGDLYSDDADERARVMSHARMLVDTAQRLGARWIRFKVPEAIPGTRTESLSAHRELAAYAEPRGVQLVVENNGWMRSKPDAVGKLLATIGRNVAAAPDTGNWDDDVRYEGIAKTCQGAVTCDFKVFDLDAEGHHAKYDIKRCFDVAWKAGFRGPWAIEHWNEDNAAFARETRYLSDRLKEWMAAAG